MDLLVLKTMGKVIVRIRVIPNDENQERELIERIKPEKHYKKPFVFGMEALYIEKILEDKEGELENLENIIRDFDVSYEIENITRVFID